MMAIKTKIEEVVKVIEKVMYIGDTTYFWDNDLITNTDSKGIKKRVELQSSAMKVAGYGARLSKTDLGWGCQRVTPKEFRAVLKNLKTGKPFQFKKKENAGSSNINFRSLVKVVRVYGESVPKQELIEKMETLIKAYDFLYKK
jgi:hypothetical protein